MFKEDPSCNRKVWTFFDGDNPIVVHNITIPDLVPEDFRLFTQNYWQIVQGIIAEDSKGPKVEFHDMGVVDGRHIMRQRMDPGVMFVSARQTFISTYTFQEGPNELSWLASSRENDNAETKFKDLIKKDVVATLEVNYYNWKPTEDGKGTHLTHVTCSKPNGSIPNMVVSKMTAAQADAAIKVAA